jgi:hypothetical protein
MALPGSLHKNMRRTSDGSTLRRTSDGSTYGEILTGENLAEGMNELAK